MTVAGVNIFTELQSCEIDHSECHCGSGRQTVSQFVKPPIRNWGPRTLGPPLVANAAAILDSEKAKPIASSHPGKILSTYQVLSKNAKK